MRRHSRFQTTSTFACLVWLWSALFTSSTTYAQPLPTPDQLDQLLAPIALFPDALVAQICAASTDPQQVLDANAWVQRNLTLTGEARTNAAQAQGFDPAFISLVNFAQVLDTMARNINDYAAIGQAFQADQGMVMDSIQRLRQQAFAAGTLQSNEFQNVNLQGQGASQVVVIQPANPQVVFVPQYNPQVVFVQPDTSAVAAASAITFGAGVALGSYLAGPSHPWAWGGWGWNWGRRSMMVQNNVWVMGGRPRPPTHVWGPPMYGRPVWVRPPPNWHSRPFYRPPPPGFRPPPPGFRPPPARPPVRPVPPVAPLPPVRPVPPIGNVPPGRPPSGSRPPGGNRPPAGGRPQRPENPYAGFPQRPGGGNASGGRPGGGNTSGGRPGGGNASGGRPGGGGAGNTSGGRRGAFAASDNPAASREASNRGRSSVASEQRQQGARRR